MAKTPATTHGVFNKDSRAGRPIDQFRSNHEEWWLNVNYAEIIDMKDAINLHTMRKTVAR
ncbi:hypothetical protein [Spongiibacter sp.]|uniref:hypothetical protein n=1 Tax=Spongiibacter sp. TaxID=2024860 RepID=UPI003567CB62